MAPVTDISQLDLNQAYSYADYLSWHFTEYVELIKGKLVRKISAPTSEYQQIATNLTVEIGRYLKRKSCQVYAAPFDVRLLRSPGNGDAQIQTVVQPDLSIICDRSKIDKRGCLGAPDWIIEIVSPSSLLLDTRTKFDLYAENGVREYWIVLPGEQAITAYALGAEGQYEPSGTYVEPGLMPSHVLPELAIEWADIFEEVKQC